MNKNEKIELLIAQGNLEYAKRPKCDKRSFAEFLSSYLIERGIEIKTCPVCDYIEELSNNGIRFSVVGFEAIYCPHCGKNIRN